MSLRSQTEKYSNQDVYQPSNIVESGGIDTWRTNPKANSHLFGVVIDPSSGDYEIPKHERGTTKLDENILINRIEKIESLLTNFNKPRSVVERETFSITIRHPNSGDTYNARRWFQDDLIASWFEPAYQQELALLKRELQSLQQFNKQQEMIQEDIIQEDQIENQSGFSDPVYIEEPSTQYVTGVSDVCFDVYRLKNGQIEKSTGKFALSQLTQWLNEGIMIRECGDSVTLEQVRNHYGYTEPPQPEPEPEPEPETTITVTPEKLTWYHVKKPSGACEFLNVSEKFVNQMTSQGWIFSLKDICYETPTTTTTTPTPTTIPIITETKPTNFGMAGILFAGVLALPILASLGKWK